MTWLIKVIYIFRYLNILFFLCACGYLDEAEKNNYSTNESRLSSSFKLTSSRGECHGAFGAFDIGSGATKVTVVEANYCQPKSSVVFRTIYKSHQAVLYGSHVKNGVLPIDMAHTGAAVLKDLMRQANLKCGNFCKKNPITWVGAVATAVFRKVNNSDNVIEILEAESGLKIKVISQQVEALLPIQSVLSLSKNSPENIAIWDMGGASTQISVFENIRASDDSQQSDSTDLDKNSIMYQGKRFEIKTLKTDLGTLSFAKILNAKKDEVSQMSNDLNPITENWLPIADEIVDAAVKESLARSGLEYGFLANKKIYGIGGNLGKQTSLYLKIQGNGKHSVSKTKMNNLSKKLVSLDSDSLMGIATQVGDNPSFSHGAASATLLTSAYMNVLAIEKYYPIDGVNLADAVLANPSLLK